MNESVELTPDADNEDALAAAPRKSMEALRRLGMRLRSITPAGLVRLLLLVGVPVIVGWIPFAVVRVMGRETVVAVSTWPHVQSAQGLRASGALVWWPPENSRQLCRHRALVLFGDSCLACLSSTLPLALADLLATI